jgi:N utilization substance protein A
VLNEEDHRATVTVSEDQQSLAIGRGGQNVRLAAKLTGWNIDINSVGGPTTSGEDGTEGTSQDSAANETTSNENTMDNTGDEAMADETVTEGSAALDEQSDEGAVEMAQAMADTSVEDDSPIDENVEGLTEQNSVVDEDDSASDDGTLTAEEETNFTDNGSVADALESRDEDSQSIADNA